MFESVFAVAFRDLADAQQEAVVHQLYAHVVVRVDPVDFQQLFYADCADELLVPHIRRLL